MSNEKDSLIDSVKKMQAILAAAKKLKKEGEPLKGIKAKPETE